MKKLLSILIILSTCIPFTSSQAEEGSNYFVVTAYYSPLPDQDHYITGNYESEKTLNGQWIAGASGRGVFSGMLAAPGKYRFGTKIYLKWLGIWSVEDRWGAIVPAGERGYSHDRIDVWVWYGDEGLRRAMYWGKRKVYGYVVDSSNPTSLDYASIPAPLWATNNLKKQSYIPDVPDVFDVSLGEWSDATLITKLQEILSELQIIDSSETTWVYDENTVSSIYDFQLEHQIVIDQSSPGAWSYGPKTRAKLQEIYTNHLEAIQQKQELLEEIETIKELSTLTAEEKVNWIWKPVYQEISPRVRALQKTLAELWYFEYKDTAIFWVKTKTSLIAYQQDKNIISSQNDLWAGIFGPATRAQFKKDLSEIFFKDSLIEKELYEEYKLANEARGIENSENLENKDIQNNNSEISQSYKIQTI